MLLSDPMLLHDTLSDDERPGIDVVMQRPKAVDHMQKHQRNTARSIQMLVFRRRTQGSERPPLNSLRQVCVRLDSSSMAFCDCRAAP